MPHLVPPFRIDAPHSGGWVRLTLTPAGLERPALVVLSLPARPELEPIARIAVGPAFPVARAVYIATAGAELAVQVHAEQGTVEVSLEPMRSLRALLGGVKARLRTLPRLGLRTIAARGIGVVRRARDGQPVGTLPLQSSGGPEAWLARYHAPAADAQASLAAVSPRAGRIGILLDARGAGESAVARTLAATDRLSVRPGAIVHMGGMGALPSGDLARLRACDLLAWLEAGEEPAPHAIAALARAALAASGMALADWIETGANGGERIVLSAGFDPVRMAAGFAPRGAVALSGEPLRRVLDRLGTDAPPGRAELMLALAGPAGPQAVAHVPSPLTRVQAGAARARVPPSPRAAADRPRASLIVPTHARAALLARCVASCLDRSSYGPLELIVIDHASQGADMRRVLDEIRGRAATLVVREEGPFNYSRLINAGVAQAAGELIVLLNDDIEATSEDWLETLVAMLEAPGIGIVGPRLLYPDGRIQHNGVALGLGGLAGHPGRGCRPDDPDPNRVDPWPRTVSAVTGACLVMRRQLFEEVGGLDEGLAIEFNDVDLCLRAAARGWRSALEPRVTLIHHEQATRAQAAPGPVQVRDRARFVARWGHRLADDPWLSPNLALEDDTCALAEPPRVPPGLAPRRRGAGAAVG